MKRLMLIKRPLFVVIMAFGKILGSDIGDFSPISLGDTWIYSNKYSTHWCCGPGDLTWETGTSTTTIRIKSKSETGDTIIYQIFEKDSVFSRRSSNSGPLPDTIEESNYDLGEVNGEYVSWPFPDGLIKRMFSNHTYPESLVTNNVVGVGFQPMEAAFRTYLKDVGLISYRDLEHRFDYELKEFNGKEPSMGINKTVKAGRISSEKVPSNVYLLRGYLWRVNGAIEKKSIKTAE